MAIGAVVLTFPIAALAALAFGVSQRPTVLELFGAYSAFGLLIMASFGCALVIAPIQRH